MTKITIFMKIFFVIIVITLSTIRESSSKLSDKRLCYDQLCSEPISIARTIQTYTPNDQDLLGFKGHQTVTVFSKAAGSRLDIWGVEINGKHGYVPFRMLQEQKVFHKDLQHEVPVPESQPNFKDSSSKSQKENKDTLNTKEESKKEEAANEQNLNQEVFDSSRVTSTFEVFDGTTIHPLDNDVPPPVEFTNEHASTPAMPEEPAVLSMAPRGIPLSLTPALNVDKSKVLEGIQFQDKNEDVPKELNGNLESKDPEDVSNQPKEEEIADSKLNNISENGEIIDADTNGKIENKEKEREAEEEDDNDGEEEEEEEEEDEEEEEFSESKNQNTGSTEAVNGKVDSEIEQKTVPLEENVDTEEKEESSGIVSGGISAIFSSIKERIISSSSENVVADKSGDDGDTISKQESSVEATEEPQGNERKEESLESSKKEQELESTAVPEFGESNLANENENTLETSFKEVVEENTTSTTVPEVTEEIITNLENTTNLEKNNASEVHEKDDKSFSKDEIVKREGKNEAEAEVEMKDATLKLDLENTITEKPEVVVSEETLFSNEVPFSTTPVNEEIQKVGANSEASIQGNITDVKLKETEETSANSNTTLDVSSEDIVKNIQDNFSGEDTVSKLKEDTNISVDKMSIEEVEKNVGDSIVNNISNIADFIESKNTTDELPNPMEIPKDVLPDFKDALSRSSHEGAVNEETSNFNQFHGNRNLLNVEEGLAHENEPPQMPVMPIVESNSEILPEYEDKINIKEKVHSEFKSSLFPNVQHESNVAETISIDHENGKGRILDAVAPLGECKASSECTADEISSHFHSSLKQEDAHEYQEDNAVSHIKLGHSNWESFLYVGLTAFTTLLFSLGYYYIENTRRDGQLIAKINKLEKELFVAMKETTLLDESLKSTKTKLSSIEDESFGSNEMVASLKADLEAAQQAKVELEDQVTMLERDLEGATEAGLELERMLREVLTSNNEVNPLAQSLEDLQSRLNEQQAANESLTQAFNLKSQEIETLSADLDSASKRCEELEVEVVRITNELQSQIAEKNNLEKSLTDKMMKLETKINELTTERLVLRKELKVKEMELKDLLEITNQTGSNNIDFEKLYNVSRIKAETSQLLEERDELKIKLSEVEGAHQLLEEHMKVINEELVSLTEQCKVVEKDKRDAETRLEVLSKFFKEKEAERQKEEAMWLQKQGEVSSTVERIHTMQNEIQNYKQQIEMLKREIVDQEREYKTQISTLETKAHEHWVIARQNERRLEESKAEASQLRNRLTLVEKNLNEGDSDVKLHRLEANGETATSPPLFLGADSSSSPIMFNSSSGIPPPPPPSYLYAPLPPYLPPSMHPYSSPGLSPYEVGQRPPPLGGRLSSPPPLPLHAGSSRYENAGSPPPPLSPPLLPPYGHHRSPPPPFNSDHIPPPPPGSLLPPPLGTTHSWEEETLPPLRNSGFHHQREQQRARNHKGSLHSSGESLDKTHHSGKV